MHLEGSHKLKASREVLWKLLNDPDVLTRTAPSLDELKRTGDDAYEAVFRVKMGPINSVFNGHLKVVDKIEPESYRILIDVKSRIGDSTAEGYIKLKKDGEETEVEFSGDAKLTGLLARMGQRVLSGVARMMTNQFFTALEKELADI